ncbi:putative quinol monooxygenase [Peribacillus deserti]|uniref:Antibiotic biosynthesis monooxygenase n=1 Tax=Peribacillus deserti TaxID=673318 RepID=A0A2N5M2Z8_9BACI|nr:putative quinol monooxygenase [Peribacillus deserti]PLT28643.1 antibiotic biosynthesis monooxygenase [Peribacillus deserti]
MIIIHASFHVNPAKQDEFLTEVQPLIAASRKESGNVSYILYKDTENDHIYTMVEVWKDAQAIAIHNQSSHFTEFVGKANEFLTAPLDVKSFDGQPVTL